MSHGELQRLLLSSFADEAGEQLSRLGELLPEIETAANRQRGELLERGLREAHNLKGAARAAELSRIEALAHEFESLLSAIERGEREALEPAHRTLQLVEGQVRAARAEAALRPAPSAVALFDELRRLVHNLASELHKDVRLEVAGADAAVDGELLGRLRSPVTHIVRNCIDHGVEAPAARAAAGKPRVGTVSIRMVSVGEGRLVIEVADDGAGIDLHQLRTRAADLGITSAEAAGRMSDQDALNLIFRPGLSTKDAVTKLSGRGVGMDAVRERMSELGGRVEVVSTPGVGTRFSLLVPAREPGRRGRLGKAASYRRPRR